MIAIDTNVLVAIHRSDSPGHRAAHAALVQADADVVPVALPWPCVHEFVNVLTHPRIFARPSSVEEALGAVQAWRDRPSTRFLGEDDSYWPLFAELVRAAGVVGPRVHDARIAAICLDHGVKELWTADRDFSRFPRLRTRNPLVG